MYKNMRPADLVAHEPHPREPRPWSGPADVTALEEELAAQRERYLRLAADFENLKKRRPLSNGSAEINHSDGGIK